jgi:adenylate cyclase
METEDVVDMLNHYFAALVNAIFRYDGTVDKFVEDAIVAVFGSPEPDSKQHEKATPAALEMQASVKRVNEERRARGLVSCDMGIAIHCGEVIRGFIGSAERMEFTVNRRHTRWTRPAWMRNNAATKASISA